MIFNMQSSTLLVHKAGDRGVRDGGRWVNLSPNVHFDTKDIKSSTNVLELRRPSSIEKMTSQKELTGIWLGFRHGGRSDVLSCHLRQSQPEAVK
ncbi:hypothetical protein TMatcc_004516 [Talaromyces marneffei ATCC 18224]